MRTVPSVLRDPRSGPSSAAGGLVLNWRAVALAAAGLVLAFTAPPHRLDLLALGVGASAAALVWSPALGPALIGASLPFFFFSHQLVGPIGVTPPGLALLLAWGAVLVRRKSLNLTWPRTPYDTPLALFLLAALLSLLVTEYPLLSSRELRAVILEPILFFWLLSVFRGSAPLALAGFLLAASLTALAAVVQLPLGIGGTEAEGVRRAQAWYPSANHLALMLGRAWPFSIAAAVAQRSWRLWPLVTLVGLALLLTFSTGGWVGALVAALVVLAALTGRRLAAPLGGAAVVLLGLASVLAIVGVLPERLNPLRQSGGFRLDLWLSSLEMIRDHPLLGIGLDNFAYVYQQGYLRALAEPNLSHPHNWLLNMWLELGLLGLIAFVWLLVIFWKDARRASRLWLVAGAMGATADMLVHGAIDNSYFLVDLAFVFWLCLALSRQPADR